MFLQKWTLVGIALTGAPAMASHYDECGFDAEVLTVSNLEKLNDSVISSPQSRPPMVLVIKLTAAEQRGGHGTCSSQVGSIRTLQLDIEERFVPGQELQLDYSTMGGLTPEGFWDQTTWTLR